MATETEKKLTPEQYDALVKTIKARFEKNKSRHEGIEWANVQSKLEATFADNGNTKLWSLNEMENTGGEPDIIGYNDNSGEYLFCDCAPESPKGRRSICYDHTALESRKEFKPQNSAMNMAAEMGIQLLTEEEYRHMQKLGNFDCKTSSWVQTPAEIRKLGGAIFCDRRYNHVFTYHNGADSYYGVRGFRGSLKI